MSILREVQISEHCAITWQSASCPGGERVVELSDSLRTGADSYIFAGTDSASIYGPGGESRLEFSPTSMYARSKRIGVPFDTIVTVTAVNWPMNVTDVIMSNPAFGVTPRSFSVQPGQSVQLTITVTPTDSGYTVGTLTFTGDMCPQRYDVSYGYAGKRWRNARIKLETPNGGETFATGAKVEVRWSGLPDKEYVLLEYSLDSGSTWEFITDSASGSSYMWTVPRDTSDNCLLRASRTPIGESDAPQHFAFETPSDFRCMNLKWSPNSRLLASMSYQRLHIWDVNIGDPIRTQDMGTGPWSLEWNPDGRRIAAAGYQTSTTSFAIYDMITGILIKPTDDRLRNGMCISWSSDGQRIASGHQYGHVNISDATGTVLHHFEESFYENVTSIDWNPSDTRIVAGAKGDSVTVWDAESGLVIYPSMREEYRDSPEQIKWSPDGASIAAAYGSQLDIWDATTHQRLHSLLYIGSIEWNHDGSRLFTSGKNSSVLAMPGATPIWQSIYTKAAVMSYDGKLTAAIRYDGYVLVHDVATGARLFQLKAYNGSPSEPLLAFSPDGKYIASTGSQGTHGALTIWHLPTTVADADVSDAVFAIFEPTLKLVDEIEIDTVAPGASRDSIVAAFVTNESKYPVLIDSLRVFSSSSNSTPTSFDIVSDTGPFTLAPQESRDVEFIYTQGSGAGLAKAHVYAGRTDRSVYITGRTYKPTIVVIGDGVIDFGRVPIGTKKTIQRRLVLRNSGTGPTTISAVRIKGPNDTSFSAIGTTPFVLEPFATSYALDVTFAPTDSGRTQAQLLIDHSVSFGYNPSPAIITLFGDGVNGEVEEKGTVLISIDSAWARVGDVISIPVRLVADSNLSNTRATEFTGQLRLNASLLTPRLPLDNGVIDGADRIVSINIPAVPDSNGLLTTVRFRVNAGTVPFTALTLENLVCDDPYVEVRTNPGLVTLLPNNAATATIQVGSDSARVGDSAIIPITLLADSNLVNSGATSISATLRFNATLLTPLPPMSLGTVDGGDRLVTIAIPLPPDTNGLLTTLHFLATAGNALSTPLTLENIVADTGSVLVNASPGTFTIIIEDSATALLRVGTDTAMPGDIVNISITLVSDSNLANSTVTSISGQLRFNATLLEPLSPLQQGILAGNDRIVDVTMPITPDSNGVLLSMQFRVGLGNDSTTVLTLENPQAQGGFVTITTESGRFTLDSLCYQGGVRLVNPNGSIGMSAVSPNPVVNGFTEVVTETLESGSTTLVLSDLQGRVIKSFHDGIETPGRRTYTIDLRNISGGAYILTLRTPTVQSSIRLEIAP